MNGFMSSLIKTVKTNHVVEPHSLLEAKDTFLFDAANIVAVVNEYAADFFIEPEPGAYRRHSSTPLIPANEVLFTHPDTHEFFPEISHPVFSTTHRPDLHTRGRTSKATGIIRKTAETVGQRISWRDAINHQVNVYDAKGRLLLKAQESRNKLVFNPGAKVHSMRFVMDLIKYNILEKTCWGDKQLAIDSILKYMQPGNDVERLVTFGHSVAVEAIKYINQYVQENPWLIYSVANVSSNIMVESSCDYRHYKCNEDLWNQLHQRDANDDLYETFRGRDNFGLMKYEDLEDFFVLLGVREVCNVNQLSDLIESIENNRGNEIFTLKYNQALTDFLAQKNGSITASTKLVNKLMGRGNGFPNRLNLNETPGIVIL